MPSKLPDWLELASEPGTPEPLVDSQDRLRWITKLFVLGAMVVLARVAQLEWSYGETFRRSALEPIVRRHSLEGIRGRILARDGTVLAVDEQRPALAIHFQTLQDPPDVLWLRRQARARLSRAHRREPALVAAEEAKLIAERQELHARLARLCGLSLEEWQHRSGRIQQRVERISRTVNRRQVRQREEPPRFTLFHLEFPRLDDDPVAPILVAEELDHHVIVEDVPLEVVAEIESNPQRYPGVRIEPRRRRYYPQGELAAHLIGHLGPAEAANSGYHLDDRIGRSGLEMQYEELLRGRRGTLAEYVHRTGEVVRTEREQEPGSGRDVTLTLDLSLQRSAEALLDSACQRRDALAAGSSIAGGAIVVLDVRSGALLAGASAPRFDPNWFAAAGHAKTDEQLVRLLSDAAHPMLNRISDMALPPGSVFKPITAAAVLESGTVDPLRPRPCRGYLHRPEAQRCMIYARHGVGHGDVNLLDALAVSCNVYFFEAAGALGTGALYDWATRFGLGCPTGIDLPNEAAGFVPQLPSGSKQIAEAQALAIGQSRLTVTPLQMARVMAALANGGLLVQPHLLNSIAASDEPITSEVDSQVNPGPQPIAGLRQESLDTLRVGLKRVVSDPMGSAHETVFLEQLSIAGKTGTAQAGGDRPDHAWFAAFCPAEAPKVAIVVALEHAGDGSHAAGPVARRLLEQMIDLGYFRKAI